MISSKTFHTNKSIPENPLLDPNTWGIEETQKSITFYSHLKATYCTFRILVNEEKLENQITNDELFGPMHIYFRSS